MTAVHQHTHLVFRVRHPLIVGLLALLHLPYGRFIVASGLPCDGKCREEAA